MSTLHEALAGADESYLAAMSSKSTCTLALRDLETAQIGVRFADGAAQVDISGEHCTVRDPLWESTCSCPSHSICRHLVGAILWLRTHPDDWTETAAPAATETPADDPDLLPETECAAIRENAAQSFSLLADVLVWGLVRLPENSPEHLEAAAVRSHALRMADAERMLRELSSLLTSCRSRRAVFRSGDFLRKFAHTAQYLTELQTKPLHERDLGVFRQAYKDIPGDLHLFPVGQRQISGDFEGTVYYFLDLDPARREHFLSYSDVRPVYYDSVNPRRAFPVQPWGAAVPMKRLMQSRLTLVGAKTADGKLSSSQKTQIAARTDAELTSLDLSPILHDDFRELAVWLSGRSQRETDRLCFIHPARCLSSGFDTHKQSLRMKLCDAAGNTAELRIDYRKEQKKFLTEMERVGRVMLETPEKPYIFLCIASFEEGELRLFPIGVHTAGSIRKRDAYHLPPRFRQREITRAPQILALLRDIEDWLCILLQSGIRSLPEGGSRKLYERAAAFGMEGLCGLLGDLTERAEGFRHQIDPDPCAVLAALTVLCRYLAIGKEKLSLWCALEAMTHSGQKAAQ